MNDKYSYLMKTGSLKNFLAKIPSIGIPEGVTIRYLYSLGFKSTNDRTIIPVLKFIKFLDGSGKPTEFYRNYRDTSQSSIILAKSIKEAYSELFKIYPDAHKQDNISLENFFRTQTGLGERAIKAMVETFKALSSMADFNTSQKSILKPISQENETNFESHDGASHTISFALSKGRSAKIHLPDDVTSKEIDRLKALLDALK